VALDCAVSRRRVPRLTEQAIRKVCVRRPPRRPFRCSRPTTSAGASSRTW